MNTSLWGDVEMDTEFPSGSKSIGRGVQLITRDKRSPIFRGFMFSPGFLLI